MQKICKVPGSSTNGELFEEYNFWKAGWYYAADLFGKKYRDKYVPSDSIEKHLLTNSEPIMRSNQAKKHCTFCKKVTFDVL